jgi:hypothetical protein
MANERRARAAPLAALYESITGAPPDDDSLQRMQRVRDALGLNDNDALWSILAVLEYYLRLYDTIPEDIREAGDFSLRNWKKQADEIQGLLAVEEQELLTRCRATAQLIEQLTQKHQASYQLAIAQLNEDGMQKLVTKAAHSISKEVANRMIGTLNVTLRTHRDRLDEASRATVAGLFRVTRWLMIGLPASIIVCGMAMVGVQWWTGVHALAATRDDVQAVIRTKTDLDTQIRNARSTLERLTARTGGAYLVSGTDGTFLVSPGGFGQTGRCGGGTGNPCIQIVPSR